MLPAAFSPAERTKRCQLFLQEVVKAARHWYDKDGNWIAGKPLPDTRERYWLAFGLYKMGENDHADAIIQKGNTDGSQNTDGSLHYKSKPTDFNIFWTNIAVALLAVHGKKISDKTRKVLEVTAREALSFLPGDRQPDYQFHGYNDNMPSKASMGMILAGEYFGDKDAVAHGVYNLRMLRAQMTRRGIHSEYNSPTYTPGTLMGMNKIARYAKNEEAREIALAVEHRLWIDVAARFHPEIGMLSGPHSRAYTIDLLGHMSGVTCLLWFALGDIVRPTPMEHFNSKTKLLFHHEGDMPFNVSERCWYAVDHLYIPDKALELFAKKKYPFRAVATAEVGDGGVDYPAHPTRIETYLEQDFTLGTSDSPWLGSHQSASFFVTYKRRDVVKTPEDFGTIFTKFVINDEKPGDFETVSVRADGTPYTETVEQGNLNSHSNFQIIQSNATALLISHPEVPLGGEDSFRFESAKSKENGPKPLSGLSELVAFSSHFGGADEIIVGGKPRSSWDGGVRHGEWLVCRRGRLLIGLRPLCHTVALGEPKITLEKVKNYEFLRTTFYKGEPRVFQRVELRQILGGFVAELASVEDYGSLAEFAAELAGGKFTDFLFTTRRVRYRRPAGKRPALEMEISWSPGSVEPRYSVINGAPIKWPLVQIDGVKNKDLPFLNEPWQSIPGYFPWPELKVANYDIPQSIGDRES